jgi:hypothetical protein
VRCERSFLGENRRPRAPRALRFEIHELRRRFGGRDPGNTGTAEGAALRELHYARSSRHRGPDRLERGQRHFGNLAQKRQRQMNALDGGWAAVHLARDVAHQGQVQPAPARGQAKRTQRAPVASVGASAAPVARCICDRLIRRGIAATTKSTPKL